MHAVGIKTRNDSHKHTHICTRLYNMFNHSIVVVVEENLVYILAYAYITVLQVVGLKLL